jgi:hypothetical protein
MDEVAIQAQFSLPDDARRNLALTYGDKLERLATETSERQGIEIEAVSKLDDPARGEIKRRMRESREAQADQLIRAAEPPTRCPEPDQETARLLCRRGFSLADVLRVYEIGRVCSVATWLEAVDEISLSEPEHGNVVSQLVRFTTEYDHRVAELIREEYERCRAELTAAGSPTRLQLIHDLLAGRKVSSVEFGYRLEGDHIGVVASGDGAEVAIAQRANLLGCPYVIVETEESLVLGWLGGSELGNAQAFVRAYSPPPGITLAFGRAYSGHDGFRRTHREAATAYTVAERRSMPVTLYENVVLEAFALREEGIAREFVADVLGELNDENEGSRRVRETVEAYFQREQNASSTAAELGVNASTVDRRLQRAHELTGYDVRRHRAELEVALRLRALLKSAG